MRLSDNRRGPAARVGRAVAVAAVATLVLLTSGTPAFAYYSTQELPGGFGWVSDDRRRVGACDTDGDGLGVRTWYATDLGRGGNVGDANGHTIPCGGETAEGGGHILHYHVCVGSRCGPEVWLIV